jgi:hypothetical protein
VGEGGRGDGVRLRGKGVCWLLDGVGGAGELDWIGEWKRGSGEHGFGCCVIGFYDLDWERKGKDEGVWTDGRFWMVGWLD